LAFSSASLPHTQEHDTDDDQVVPFICECADEH
jgi:hypothetical protein